MRVIYEPTISPRISEECDNARRYGLTIEKIVLTPVEMSKLKAEFNFLYFTSRTSSVTAADIRSRRSFVFMGVRVEEEAAV